MTLKAISVKQPWAWALFHGKDVENRLWATHFTGQLLIHASKNFDWQGYDWLIKNSFHKFVIGEIPHPDNYIFGVIVGSVTMTDCVISHPSPFFFGPYGHVYKDPIVFKNPIPFKGALKFFDVPDELIKGVL